MELSKALRKAPLLVLISLALVLLVPAVHAPGNVVTVQTDAASYYVGQKITISGTVTPTPGPNTAVVITIRAPDNRTVVDVGDDPVIATGAYSQVTVAGGTPNWVAGTYTVNATWGGYGNTATAVTTFKYSPTAPAATTTTVACTSPVAIGATSTCTATVAGATGTIAGETVTFSLQSGTGVVTLPSTPTCSLTAGGTCSITVTGAAVGSATLKASYPGDSGNLASSGTGSLTVTTATTRTAISCTPASIAVAATATCTVTVSGTTGNVAGTAVTFSQASGSVGQVTMPSPATCMLSAGATCSITVTGSAAGSVTLSASYPGDSNNGASAGTATFAVLAPTTTTTTTTTTTSSTPSSTSTTTTTHPTTTTSTTSTTTSQSQTTTSTTTSSSGGGLGAYTYVAIAAVVIIIAGIGIVMWRRKVASDFAKSGAR